MNRLLINSLGFVYSFVIRCKFLIPAPLQEEKIPAEQVLGTLMSLWDDLYLWGRSWYIWLKNNSFRIWKSFLESVSPERTAEWKEVISPSEVKFTWSCLSLWDPKDSSLPGSSVPGILQARILEWVAIPFSKGSSQLRDWTQVSCIYIKLTPHVRFLRLMQGFS